MNNFSYRSIKNFIAKKVLIGFLILLTAFAEQTDPRTVNFPKQTEYVLSLPSNKKNFWIFIMAGQSNMAGRGFVEPEDTVASLKVYTINKQNQWVLAKEPLHFYEPALTGLDCGLSFGKHLSESVDDNIHIGIIPTAVGGSAVEQWLGDSAYRGVKLFTNFKTKVEMAAKVGTIKGILWHQGETNAHEKPFRNYKANLQELFMRFRAVAQDKKLPILAGELGSFLRESEFGHYADSVNFVLKGISEKDKNVLVIETSDLTHKGDSLHFNSASQRTMGKRFADRYLKLK
jgi:hypothetical protein